MAQAMKVWPVAVLVLASAITVLGGSNSLIKTEKSNLKQDLKFVLEELERLNPDHSLSGVEEQAVVVLEHLLRKALKHRERVVRRALDAMSEPVQDREFYKAVLKAHEQAYEEIADDFYKMSMIDLAQTDSDMAKELTKDELAEVVIAAEQRLKERIQALKESRQ